jgi:transcriptional regulator with XRE-family HTH domain
MSRLMSGGHKMHQEKREARLMPNEQLRQERLRRGWSRAYIAEQIGVADPKTIGRWERGEASPSAYFLQRLCALFEMAAEGLGLWHGEHSYISVESSSLYFLPSSHTPLPPVSLLLDFALPPAHTEALLGRNCLLSQLKLRLGAQGAAAVAALSGLPGVGKTAVVAHLAHDNDIQHHFSDGILWADLGPQASLLEELRRWGSLLEIDESWLAHPERIEDWTRAIHARIGARRMLLIIDDAWNCEDALAFKIGGPHCAYLLTTRIPAIALFFAGAGACAMHPLGEEESLHLLERFVPDLLLQEAAHIRELARLAGGLPLALEILGMHLQAQVGTGQPRRWRAALERFQQPEVRQQLTMPRSPLQRQKGLPTSVPLSLQTTIELSYQRLDAATREALLALAQQLVQTGSFSEATALSIEGLSLEALDSLLDAGLLISTGQGHYMIHQSIVDFACCQTLLAAGTDAMPPQVRVLRQVRERGEYTACGGHLLDETSSVLVQTSEEAVRFSSS